MNRTVRRAGALMAAGMLTVGLGACGDDDDEDETSTGAAAGSEESAAADDADFCDAAVAVEVANVGVSTGDTTPEDVEDAFEAAIDAAPDEIADAVQTMVTETREATPADGDAPQGEGPPPIPADAFFTASVEVGAYLADNCGFETIDVTATDYAFDGFPESAPAGMTVVSFDNQGTEFHEVVLMQVAEGEERPLDELVALPEAEMQSLVTDKMFVFSPPGAGAYATVDLEPGRYVAICFVPVGATPEAMATGTGLGDPHFAHGMVTEFEVA